MYSPASSTAELSSPIRIGIILSGWRVRKSGIFSLNLGNNSPLISLYLGQFVRVCVYVDTRNK